MADRNALHIAAFHGYLDIVDLLLSLEVCPVEGLNDRHDTPLQVAVKRGHIHIVRLLVLKGGADVNAVGVDASTPLHVAAAANHAPMVCCLLALGGDPNRDNAWGDSPLGVAVRAGNDNPVRCLLPYVRPQTLERGMQIAGTEADVGCIHTMLAHIHTYHAPGFLPPAIDRGMQAALHGALYTGSFSPGRLTDAVAVLRALVAAGADVDVADWLGTTL